MKLGLCHGYQGDGFCFHSLYTLNVTPDMPCCQSVRYRWFISSILTGNLDKMRKNNMLPYIKRWIYWLLFVHACKWMITYSPISMLWMSIRLAYSFDRRIQSKSPHWHCWLQLLAIVVTVNQFLLRYSYFHHCNMGIK